MKKTFHLCSMAFLAFCVAGCGNDAPASPNADSAAAAADFDTLMRKSVAAVAQKDAATATACATGALEAQPESAEAHLLAGQAACLGEDYARAREEFASVIKEKSLPAALRSRAYAGIGTVEFEQHDAESARISFLYALLLDYKNEAAQYYLGRIYREVYHFYEAAKDHFQMFVYMKPGTPLADKVKSEYIPELQRAIDGKAAERLGARGEGAAQAAKLIQEAQGLEDKKRYTEAVKKFEAARKADPNSDVAALGYARLVVVTDKSAEGARKAIRAYYDAIAIKPSALGNYIKAAQLARNYDPEFRIQAVEILNHALAHHPREPKALDQLIAALRKTGNSKLANAWDEYRRAVEQR